MHTVFKWKLTSLITKSLHSIELSTEEIMWGKWLDRHDQLHNG